MFSIYYIVEGICNAIYGMGEKHGLAWVGIPSMHIDGQHHYNIMYIILVSLVLTMFYNLSAQTIYYVKVEPCKMVMVMVMVMINTGRKYPY